MRSEKEKMLDGERYDPTAPELVADRNRARDLTRRYNDTRPDEQTARPKKYSSTSSAQSVPSVR